ncbi:MAG: 50S rRNA methyltransferase, partial [Desulfovibrio sp.]|nr:50S rRNA methyltransferase [Desulfovibrio sp.]
MAVQLHGLFVGKCREAALREAADLYTLKLSRLARVELALVKDAPAALPPQEKCQREGRDILARLDPRHLPVVLDE